MSDEAKQVTFTIPGEPRAKGRPRMTRSGHAYTPEKTVAYENLVKITYMNDVGKIMPFGDRPLCAEICAHMRVPKSASKKLLPLMLSGVEKPTKKPDGDNVAKAVLDALNGLAYRDDSMVTTVTVKKRWATEPCVIVTIWEDMD